MKLIKHISNIDTATIIIICLGVVVAFLLYYNNRNQNENNAGCNCGIMPETMENIGTSEEVEEVQHSTNQVNSTNNNKFTVYYTEWCGHSKNLMKEWNENFIPTFEKSDLNGKVTIEKVDCEQNKDICKNIQGYPTIILSKEDGTTFDYNGERTTDRMIDFIRRSL